MKAMLLAAGRGERMMPLTAKTPKPLLRISDKPLLEYHIENLVNAGLRQIVINHSYLGQQIENYFGDGAKLGAQISWSRETSPLETAGGIIKALPKLGEQPFILINGDVWCPLSIDKFVNSPHIDSLKRKQTLAHLLLVKNPQHNPTGDFGLIESMVVNKNSTMWTYSGIAVLHPDLFRAQICAQSESNQRDRVLALAPVLREAADHQKVTAEIFDGDWQDIGTPERLDNLRSQVKTQSGNK
ncbi:N-acetylmuramate alpha-1-phosphate uridylyltransferase MurU [Aliikangiella coralliicola]|uniref:Nucleotidyltransferase family protein n=1 Tax=Aliikangiella coralliicola TaxID=2592383 RepID=A0A545UE27_9GAMM|nr:nucleotidyltransferase family protein [Aliikangiella coralliicola]TQV87722.1 nucleotidyltransferase family protein [Aliikangiella coralliicola]